MRKLSNNFIDSLKNGFLSNLLQKVINDKDLDLQIRSNYINLYYKGNSLLKLTEVNSKGYSVDINEKFSRGLTIPDFIDNNETAKKLLDQIPSLKENIIKQGNTSLEIEYEQLVIRANNFERRNNSEYFIIDRQHVVSEERLDLIGFFWDRKYRRITQEVPLCFMEVKFALSNDISDIHDQVDRYYKAVKEKSQAIAEEAQQIFRQKLELGLFDQPKNRLNAMKTLTFSTDINQFQFVIILVDYNFNSLKFDISKLSALPFSNQIKIFLSGFAMWKQNTRSIEKCRHLKIFKNNSTFTV